MKICQIMICKGFGGAERAFVDSCLSLIERGHDVLAIIDKGSKSEEKLQQTNVPYTVINLVFRQNPLAKWSLQKILSQFKPDIVHAHLRRSMDFAGRAATKMKLPVVASIHNYNSIKTYANADHLIALTKDHYDFIINSNAELKSKTSIIPNFSRLAPKKSSLNKPSDLKLLSYGRFVHKKGFDVLIKAFADVCQRHSGVRLTLAGDGPLKKELAGLISELKLTDKISLLPWSNSVAELLDEHDAFILPSRIEPFGIVALEAMARGKLIVSTRSEGPVQFLNPDVALLCEIDSVGDLARQINYLVKNKGSLQPLADKACDYYKNTFHVDVVLPQLEEMYRKLLNAR